MEALPRRVSQIEAALLKIGTGTPSEIQRAIAEVEEDPPAPESVRARLQEYSSDSGQFKGRQDVFYSVDGIGRGIWGLRASDPLSATNTDGFIDDVVAHFSDIEGRLVLYAHLRRERSTRLVREFKQSLKNFARAACDFDFAATYGELATNYIEAHHIVPLASLSSPKVNSIDDLIGLCSNCHSVLHLNPGLGYLDLRQRLLRSKQAGEADWGAPITRRTKNRRQGFGSRQRPLCRSAWGRLTSSFSPSPSSARLSPSWPSSP